MSYKPIKTIKEKPLETGLYGVLPVNPTASLHRDGLSEEGKPQAAPPTQESSDSQPHGHQPFISVHQFSSENRYPSPGGFPTHPLDA